MKHNKVRSIGCLIALALFAITSFPSTGFAQGRGIYGDWNIETQFGEMTFQSILSFSRDQDGNLTGDSINFFGINPLKDISLEDGQLQYTLTRMGRDGAITSKFKGTVADGKLSGTMSSDQGDTKITGERAPRVSRAVGSWAVTIKAGEREYTGTLDLTSNDSGDLAGTWTSQRGTAKVSDVKYSRGELSFKRIIETQDNKWEMTFSGNIRGNELTGVSKSDRGEAEVTGKRKNAAAIGTWNLISDFNGRSSEQRLRINGDMSGLYGSLPIEDVKLENNQLAFKATSSFGDREFTWTFKGNIDGDSMKGEITTGQGTREVTGKKVVRTFRRTQ